MGPSGVGSEASERTLLEDWVRGMVSDGDVDREDESLWGEGGGGRRDEDATGWAARSRGSRRGGLCVPGRGAGLAQRVSRWLAQGRAESVLWRALRARAMGETSLERPRQSMLGARGRDWEEGERDQRRGR